MSQENLKFKFLADTSNFQNGIKKVEGTLQSSTKKITSLMGSQLAGAFSTVAIVGFGKAVIDATAEYQKFGAVLGNTLGSSALANLKLKELQDFAAKTPFGVNELTGSFVKLANAGFKPTGREMTKLGDLASSTGKGIDQLAEAIIDAQTGEFERLKEFGIRAKDAGDSVIFTYKGVQQTVDKTAGSIRGYITSLGDAEGVSGSMSKISETLGGKISNLGDSWDQLLISVGANTSGVFSDAISIMGKAIDSVTRFNRELEVSSKFNVGRGVGNFLDTIYKYSPGGAIEKMLGGDKADTDRDKTINGIIKVQDQVSKFVSEAIAGAKSTEDFGKALAGLKTMGAKGINFGTSGTVEKGAVKAVADAYQQGVKAIQDARTNFGKTTSDANFGTGKSGKEVKTVSDILKELDKSLRQTKYEFQKTFDEKSLMDIDKYQDAIRELAKIGGGDAVSAIQKLQKAQQSLVQLTPSDTQKSFASQAPKTRNSEGTIGIKFDGSRGKDPFDSITEAQKKLYETQQQFNNDFNSLISSGLGSGIGDAFSSIGEAFASGGDVMDAMGKSILKSFTGFLSSFGDMLIQYGTAAVLKGKLDVATLIPGGGIVAGAAAIAAGAALKLAAGAFAGILGGGNSKGNKNDQKGAKQTAFANGGIVSGMVQNATIGEYSSASRGNPEIISPLTKLKSLLPQPEGLSGDLQFRIEGTDLVAILNKQNTRNYKTI